MNLNCIDILYTDNDIFHKIGHGADMTDFAILTGGYVKDGKGMYWTSNLCVSQNEPYVIKPDGGLTIANHYSFNIGVRLVVKYSDIEKDVLHEAFNNGVYECAYGEYSKNVVSLEEANVLETMYMNNQLKIADKSNTSYDMFNHRWVFIHNNIYNYEGKKYIRYIASHSYADNTKLSDGREVIKGSAYWLALEPIVFYVDKKKDIAISKNIIIAGIPFAEEFYNDKENYYKNGLMKYYMDNYLINEIIVKEKDKIINLKI